MFFSFSGPRRFPYWSIFLSWGLILFLRFDPPVFAEPLKWEQNAGYRSAKVTVAQGEKVGFAQLTNARLGIRFTNALPFQKFSANHNLLNGAGVAAGDFDGDGWCDLYFCGVGGRNALYRNLGNWHFEEVTDNAGVACTNQLSTGAVFADLNGDGWLDLFITSCGGPNACFINDGHGHFQNVTEAAGLVSKYGGTSVALADIDGDGDLDLYVANYGENTIRSGLNLTTRTVAGKEVVTGRYANRIKIINGRLVEYGEPDALYLNDGKGKFSAVSWTDGTFLDASGHPLTSLLWDMGLSVQFRDLNGDGAPDIYVCNDFQTPDRVWINDGQGHFRALPADALSHTSHFSMTMDCADINRDGWPDFFVADMDRRSHRDRMHQMEPADIVLSPGEVLERPQIRRNTLFLNRGDGTWVDIANYAGVGATDWTWSGIFLDVDLDGFEDLLIANGHAFDTEDLDASEATKALGKQRPQDTRTNILVFPKLEVPNAVFRNGGNLTFQDVSKQWGFESQQVSHGIALGDLDNDGDLDVVVNCLNAPPLIYRNETTAGRVAVRLKGAPPNTQGIGAKVELLGGPVPQSQEILSGGHYLSGSDPARVFASGNAVEGMTLTVTWRDGKQNIVSNVIANRIYELDEIAAPPGSLSRSESPRKPPLFEEASDLLNHKHRRQEINDFARQPLLPRKLSLEGPGVAWVDLNGDGHDELVIGGGGSAAFGVFRFSEGKAATVASSPGAGGDVAGLASWTTVAGQVSLLAALSSNATNSTGPSVLQLSWPDRNQNAQVRPALTMPPFNPGPLATADIDGDGDLDLFLGEQAIPGRYPEANRSAIFRNENGELRLDSANTERLASAGVINGAVFSDLDGDGLPELILACEWGPIRVFRNRAGQFSEATSELGFAQFPGWWQGVTTGDFDGDGRLDVVASNWGLNSTYEATAESPAYLYYGDFGGAGVVDLIEAEWDAEQKKVVPRRLLQDVAASLPYVRGRFATHRAYAEASVAEVLGDAFAKAKELKATTLASMVFLNRGDHFEPSVLPPEAQFAPSFGVCVADFDGDGREDAFLAQNFSGTQQYMPAPTEGRGLLLLGDGQGHFSAMTSEKSGIKMSGDQRGAAVGDFDEDGRADLAVGQNGSATKLFHNTQAKPGLRVRLIGPASNPSGIGGVLRVKSGDHFGPVREIHAGAGYWSQDSLVPVLSSSGPIQKIWVRWPGGRITETDVSGGANSVEPKYGN